MNSPAKSPTIDDAHIYYKEQGRPVRTGAYGPYNVKVLRNYRGDAWYPGQNADTFAWYAMAMWAKKEIGYYPELPKSGGRYPLNPPRRGNGEPFLAADQHPEESSDLVTEEIPYSPVEGFTIPSCPSVQMDTGGSKEIPVLNVSCVDNASVIPSKIFSSDGNQVYHTFCRGAWNNRRQLHWIADVFGNLNGNLPFKTTIKRSSRLFGKREDKPEQFTNWQFQLDWSPKSPFNSDNCYLDCPTAFSALAATPECSQKGEGKNLMSSSGQIDVGCGTHGYTIKGIAIS